MKKLRNAGGIEAWYSDEEAALHLASGNGWTEVSDAPAQTPAPADEPDAPEAEEAPKPKKSRK